MGKYHRFTKEEIATIVNLKEQGLANKDVALHTGKTETQIRDLLFRLKRKERPARETLAETIKDRIIEGKTYREIGEELHISKSLVGKIVAELSPNTSPIKPEKTLKDFDPRDMFRQLYDLGYRIDDKGIYIMVKQYVNLKSIISE